MHTTEELFDSPHPSGLGMRAERLIAIEPALTFDAAADQAPTTGSVAYAASAATVTLATRSATGTCFTSATAPPAARRR